MQSYFILAGENLELAKDELVSISKSYDIKSRFSVDSRLFIVKSGIPPGKIATRATFIRASGVLIGTYDQISDVSIPPNQTFACRIINLSSKKVDAASLEREAGAIIRGKTGSRVSLSNPSTTVHIIITDKQSYLGYSDHLKRRKTMKKIKYPTQLDWKTGRCMLNLSQMHEGERICDPFCGTGTILLEAEEMGMISAGIDFDYKMCQIARKNLVLNGYIPRIINSTYRYMTKLEERLDAVVTDLPYGTASRSTAPPIKIIQDFVSVVSKKTKLVMVYKKGMDLDELAKAKKYELYRHKSLTRVIAVR